VNGSRVRIARRKIKVLVPRALPRAHAAAYLGISPTLFDRAIKDGLMPKPVRIYGRIVWDRLQLDLAFSALLNDNDGARDGGDEGYDQRPTT
jgi:hypothetical protein